MCDHKGMGKHKGNVPPALLHIYSYYKGIQWRNAGFRL